MTRPRAKEMGKPGPTHPDGQASDSLSYLRIVDDITRSGITQAELSQAVGASLRTVQNWAAGNGSPAGAKIRRLLDVQYIVHELRGAYTEEGVQIWMHARNRNLDGQRPIDLLAADRYDEVLAEAEHVSGAM